MKRISEFVTIATAFMWGQLVLKALITMILEMLLRQVFGCVYAKSEFKRLGFEHGKLLKIKTAFVRSLNELFFEHLCNALVIERSTELKIEMLRKIEHVRFASQTKFPLSGTLRLNSHDLFFPISQISGI